MRHLRGFLGLRNWSENRAATLQVRVWQIQSLTVDRRVVLLVPRLGLLGVYTSATVPNGALITFSRDDWPYSSGFSVSSLGSR
jgi:hypothetical protein